MTESQNPLELETSTEQLLSDFPNPLELAEHYRQLCRATDDEYEEVVDTSDGISFMSNSDEVKRQQVIAAMRNLSAIPYTKELVHQLLLHEDSSRGDAFGLTGTYLSTGLWKLEEAQDVFSAALNSPDDPEFVSQGYCTDMLMEYVDGYVDTFGSETKPAALGRIAALGQTIGYDLLSLLSESYRNPS